MLRSYNVRVARVVVASIIPRHESLRAISAYIRVHTSLAAALYSNFIDFSKAIVNRKDEKRTDSITQELKKYIRLRKEFIAKLYTFLHVC